MKKQRLFLNLFSAILIVYIVSILGSPSIEMRSVEDYGSGVECVFGCDGECNSGKVFDECGVCGGDNTSCADCEGVPNGGAIDFGCGCAKPGPSGCDYQCGSTRTLDECMVCGGDNTSCADCAGVANGGKVVDACGICGGDSSTCKDCAGVPNGTAKDLGCGCDQPAPSGCDNQCGSTKVLDDCGVCGGDNSTCTDCAGIPNGGAEVDECGVCGGDGTSCLDCAGVPNGGKVVDACGVCGGDSSTCKDCAGVPNGTAKDLGCGCNLPGPSGCDNQCGSTKVVDACGVCGGDNSTCKDCAGVPKGGKVVDICGVCGGDGKSCLDCAGVLNGQAKDLGCGCNMPGPSGCDNQCGSTKVTDSCGVCGGSGPGFCGCNSPTNTALSNKCTGYLVKGDAWSVIQFKKECLSCAFPCSDNKKTLCQELSKKTKTRKNFDAYNAINCDYCGGCSRFYFQVSPGAKGVIGGSVGRDLSKMTTVAKGSCLERVANDIFDFCENVQEMAPLRVDRYFDNCVAQGFSFALKGKTLTTKFSEQTRARTKDFCRMFSDGFYSNYSDSPLNSEVFPECLQQVNWNIAVGKDPIPNLEKAYNHCAKNINLSKLKNNKTVRGQVQTCMRQAQEYLNVAGSLTSIPAGTKVNTYGIPLVPTRRNMAVDAYGIPLVVNLISSPRGTYYVDSNSCAAAKPLGDIKICDAGQYIYYESPVSLIWEEGASVESQGSLVQFKLNPQDENGLWYEWKASGKTPLLVYDPEHKGDITSPTQLFGDWTFGGKNYVALESSDERRDLTSQAKWRDGYEALGTLDSNADGKIAGEELAPLGLWFDENQDGVSQAGEVKVATETGLKALYYKADYRDDKTKTLHVTKGFEREVDGKIVTGGSVDWYGAKHESPFDLIFNQPFE